MTTLLILISVVILLVLIFPRNIMIWVFVFLITDPVGIANQYLGKNQLGGFFYVDVFFIITFVFLLFGKEKIKMFFNNPAAKGIFVVLFIFSIYKVFVWGLILPDKDFSYFFRYCLVRERDSIYGFAFIIPVYLFAMKDLKSFLNIIIYGGFLILLLAAVSFVFKLNIVQVTSGERYLGSGILRHFFNSYGLLLFLVPASITVFVGRISLKNRPILFWGGIISIVSIIITLTKNQYLFLLGLVLSSVYLTTRLLKLKASKSVSRIIIFIFSAILILNISFPKYSDYATMAFRDIISLVTTGETVAGETSRLWQVPATLYEIKRHPLFGTGLGYDQLNTIDFDVNQFDATDFPLLTHIMQYGMIGIFIYILYYFKVYRLIKKLNKQFLELKPLEIVKYFKYEVIFTIASIAYFVGYFVRGYTIFIELTSGLARIEMSIYTGLLLACMERIRIKLNFIDQEQKTSQALTTEG